MTATAPTAEIITCARPGCETRVPLAESGYIDGCGQVCLSCLGPVPAWFSEIEPPF
jgi:hypothetical protein